MGPPSQETAGRHFTFQLSCVVDTNPQPRAQNVPEPTPDALASSTEGRGHRTAWIQPWLAPVLIAALKWLALRLELSVPFVSGMEETAPTPCIPTSNPDPHGSVSWCLPTAAPAPALCAHCTVGINPPGTTVKPWLSAPLWLTPGCPRSTTRVGTTARDANEPSGEPSVSQESEEATSPPGCSGHPWSGSPKQKLGCLARS